MEPSVLTLVGLLAFGVPDLARVVSTTVHGSLEASLSRLEPEAGPALAAQVARLLRWRGDVIKDVHAGDAITLLWEEGPELVALDYAGAAITLRAYRFDRGDGVPRFWDESGALVEPGLAHSPLASYVQITELKQRGRGKRKHDGLDLKAPIGTPVRLPWPAVVSRVNWSRRGNGNCVEIRYTDGEGAGIVARFLHLDSVEKAVQPGVRLEAGALIGAVGNTGHSTSPHLHYETRDAAGGVLDPLKIHGTLRVRLDASASEPFAASRGRYDAALPVRQNAAGSAAGTLAAPAE
jgi:murein DD-endopeptidase